MQRHAGRILADDFVGLGDVVIFVGADKAVVLDGDVLIAEELEQEPGVVGIGGEARKAVGRGAAAEVLGHFKVAKGVAGLGEFGLAGGFVIGEGGTPKKGKEQHQDVGKNPQCGAAAAVRVFRERGR